MFPLSGQTFQHRQKNEHERISNAALTDQCCGRSRHCSSQCSLHNLSILDMTVMFVFAFFGISASKKKYASIQPGTIEPMQPICGRQRSSNCLELAKFRGMRNLAWSIPSRVIRRRRDTGQFWAFIDRSQILSSRSSICLSAYINRIPPTWISKQKHRKSIEAWRSSEIIRKGRSSRHTSPHRDIHAHACKQAMHIHKDQPKQRNT